MQFRNKKTQVSEIRKTKQEAIYWMSESVTFFKNRMENSAKAIISFTIVPSFERPQRESLSTMICPLQLHVIYKKYFNLNIHHKPKTKILNPSLEPNLFMLGGSHEICVLKIDGCWEALILLVLCFVFYSLIFPPLFFFFFYLINYINLIRFLYLVGRVDGWLLTCFSFTSTIFIFYFDRNVVTILIY